MGVGRTAEGGECCEWEWVLVMFVTVDGEDIARKVFRRAQSGINSEGRGRENKGFYTNP